MGGGLELTQVGKLKIVCLSCIHSAYTCACHLLSNVLFHDVFLQYPGCMIEIETIKSLVKVMSLLNKS